MGEQNNAYLDKICQTIYQNTDAVYLINNEEKTYTQYKASDFWNKLLGRTGSLNKLYQMLFVKRIEDNEIEQNEYKVFVDDDFFKRELYQGNIIMSDKGVQQEYFIQLVKISDIEAGLVVYLLEDKVENDRLELEKIDTIQDTYLFSMIVNLNDDTCINANTTEVSASRQDFMDIKYSDWRMMITKMFFESDRSVFLRISSPEYIINNLEEKNSYHSELQMMNMQGKYIWVRVSFTRMKNFSRQKPRFVYTVRDVHEEMLRLLKQESIVEAVTVQNKKLEQADKEKSKYFSSMSHEIRTPINAILGMNEVIIRESAEESIKGYAKEIQNAGKILLSIVNDILDLSKIEAGKMEIIPVEYSPKKMINDISNIISIKVEEKSLNFKLDISNDLPKRLYGDEIRITQIILNLLTNAIKYTEQGDVTLCVANEKDDNGHYAMKVCVKDTGIGIKQEDMDKLFSDFERLDTHRNRNVEGTGLGMSIVVGLLGQMNGRLSVQSVYGEGSTFSFVLPQKIVDITPDNDLNEKNKKQNKKTFTAPGKNILVVDDNRVNLKVFGALLKPAKTNVELSSSGRDCLEKLKSNNYDIIFMDHMMPQMDGIETLRKIKELGDEYAHIPVVALTANSSSGARDKYISYGFNDYLEKPINADRLYAVLEKYLSDK